VGRVGDGGKGGRERRLRGEERGGGEGVEKIVVDLGFFGSDRVGLGRRCFFTRLVGWSVGRLGSFCHFLFFFFFFFSFLLAYVPFRWEFLLLLCLLAWWIVNDWIGFARLMSVMCVMV
jgi:hypothetical protein